MHMRTCTHTNTHWWKSSVSNFCARYWDLWEAKWMQPSTWRVKAGQSCCPLLGESWMVLRSLTLSARLGREHPTTGQEDCGFAAEVLGEALPSRTHLNQPVECGKHWLKWLFIQHSSCPATGIPTVFGYTTNTVLREHRARPGDSLSL